MNQVLLNSFNNIFMKNKKIVFVYVFGSFVSKGTYNDIDFAIYLSDGEIDTFEYLDLKRELMDISSKEIDIVILNEVSPIIKHEVFRYGIRLFSRNDEIESNFVVHSLFEYEDMKKYYDLSYNVMIEHTRKEVESSGKKRSS